MVERSDFVADHLDRFWAFVAERQRAWYRRVVLEAPAPWTHDDALRRHRFTNVYRVLDPGTQYAVQSILAREAPAPDRLFNLLRYRLIGRPSTHAAVGFTTLDGFDAAAFEADLRAVQDRGGPVFTGAYLVSGYAGMGGADKVENVAWLFGAVADRFDAFVDRVDGATHPKEVYDAIRDLPGFGNFLAYQVLVDLTYPVPSRGGESSLPFSPDTWAAAGPGAKRGLDRLLVHGRASADRELEAMRWLWCHQRDAFDRLDLEFVWLRDADGARVPLSLADVQNCCCEYAKYDAIASGEGRARRRFRPDQRRSASDLRSIYTTAAVSLDPDDYVGRADR